MSEETKSLKVSLLVAALMLCIAVIPALPHVYFTLLRFVVCGAAAYAAVKLKSSPSLGGHFIPLLIVAVLFNPLRPVFLTPLIWLVLDLGVAVYFLKLSKKI
jgi:flagellar biosynthesis component FlhA